MKKSTKAIIGLVLCMSFCSGKKYVENGQLQKSNLISACERENGGTMPGKERLVNAVDIFAVQCMTQKGDETMGKDCDPAFKTLIAFCGPKILGEVVDQKNGAKN